VNATAKNTILFKEFGPTFAFGCGVATLLITKHQYLQGLVMFWAPLLHIDQYLRRSVRVRMPKFFHAFCACVKYHVLQ